MRQDHQPQNTQTDFPIVVQVGIKPHPSCVSRHELHFRRPDRIVARTLQHEIEEATLVGSVHHSHDYRVYESHVGFVAHNEQPKRRVGEQVHQVPKRSGWLICAY